MTSRKKVWLLTAGVAALVFGTLAIVVVDKWSKPHVRAWLTRVLSEQLDSNVQLDDITVELGRTVKVIVHGVVIRHRLYPDAPPLVHADAFSMEASILAVLHSPLRVSS